MTAAPSPTAWTTGDTITEVGLDADETAVNFLRSPPRASLARSSNQTITDSTDTAVQFNSEDYDSVAGHSTVTNNSRYTAQYDGIYLVTFAVPWSSVNVELKTAAWIKKSDGTEYAPSEIYKNTFSVTITNTGSHPVELLTGEYVEIYCWHDKGSNHTINASQHGGPRMGVLWVSAI